MDSCFHYCRSTPSYDTKFVYFARIGGEISSSAYLLKAFNYIFSFPGYYGFNWNALFSCLRDLSWIKEKKVILYHEDLPSIDEKELRIYLEILQDTIIDWKGDNQHDFIVYFMEKDKHIIQSIIKNKEQ